MSGKSLPVNECFEIKSQFYDNYQTHSDGCPLDAPCLCSPQGPASARAPQLTDTPGPCPADTPITLPALISGPFATQGPTPCSETVA